MQVNNIQYRKVEALTLSPPSVVQYSTVQYRLCISRFNKLKLGEEKEMFDKSF